MSAIERREVWLHLPCGDYHIVAVPLQKRQWGWEVWLNGALIARSGKHHQKTPGAATQHGKRWVTGDRALRAAVRR